jgi:hypothetical protein
VAASKRPECGKSISSTENLALIFLWQYRWQSRGNSSKETVRTWHFRGKSLEKLKEKVAMKRGNREQSVENMGKPGKKLLTPAGSHRSSAIIAELFLFATFYRKHASAGIRTKGGRFETELH